MSNNVCQSTSGLCVGTPIAPLAPDRTQVICVLFTDESLNSPDTNLEGAVEFWDLTNRQDWRVCELTQRGVSSVGYKPGLYSE